VTVAAQCEGDWETPDVSGHKTASRASLRSSKDMDVREHLSNVRDTEEFIKAMADKNNQAKTEALQFFAYQHLPEHLRAVSQQFCEMAHEVYDSLPDNVERSMALRKLLEAKDCAVRALLYKKR